MRAIWKGYLKVSLVTIPIKLYNAINKRKSIQFNLLHNECKTRIKQKTFCPNCNRELSDDEIVRGYQYGKDMFVIITDEDLLKVKKESTEAIEILKFIDVGKIHPIYYSESYYIVPDGKIGAEAFSLFHKAMSETKKTALAKVVLRNREHLFSISPYNGTFIAYGLYYPDEIQRIEKIEELEEIGKVSLDSNALSMAKAVINNMSGDFRPEEFVDEYSQGLMEIIKAKIEGEEIKVKPEVERAKVISLMDALEKSLKETEKSKEIPRKEMATAGKKPKKARIKEEKAVDAG